MHATTRARLGTGVVAVAAAAASDTLRWQLADLTIAVGYGLLVPALLGIRSHLHEAGEERLERAGAPAHRPWQHNVRHPDRHGDRTGGGRRDRRRRGAVQAALFT